MKLNEIIQAGRSSRAIANEISSDLCEEDGKPLNPEQLQIKALEKKKKEATAEIALQKAMNKKNKAQGDYTRKATDLSRVRASR